MPMTAMLILRGNREKVACERLTRIPSQAVFAERQSWLRSYRRFFCCCLLFSSGFRACNLVTNMSIVANHPPRCLSWDTDNFWVSWAIISIFDILAPGADLSVPIRRVTATYGVFWCPTYDQAPVHDNANSERAICVLVLDWLWVNVL